ncbi:type II toxin-antitoxin system Phd/YefM family antitoxin [Herbiconiux ginsengi]|nr:type II toxin-antitoxin system Phd/YefM family antitoxin [Herbiconiux ginsengi]
MSVPPITLSVSEARKNLSAMVDHAHSQHAPVYLERHGRRVAAIVDADDLDALLALAEDMEDIRAAEAARAELRRSPDGAIPWDEVKRDLGLG